VGHAILDTDRTSYTFAISHESGINVGMGVVHCLSSVEVGAISKDLVVFPDVCDLDTTREGGRGDEIDSKLFPTKELLQEGEVSLGAVGAD